MPEEEKKTPLEMAEDLDLMEDRDLPSGEAAFLDVALKILKAERALKPKDQKKLEQLYEKYLGDKEVDGDAPPFDRGKGGDDDVDPEDFA